MLEEKKDGLSVYVESTRVVGDVSIGMCFDIECNGCSMGKLCGGASCCCAGYPAGSEEAALCYALYLAVRQVLCGDPLAVLKTKVGNVSCVAHNGMFGINWKVKGTGSAVRKSIGLALKVLDPAKMFPAYSRHIRQLGGSPNKDAFSHVADAVAKKISSNLTVGVVGNIKIDKEKLKAMMEVLTKKHNVSSVSGTKTKPSGHKACEHSDCCDVKVSGWASAVVSDFIMAKVKGLTPCVCDAHLHLHLKPGQWDTLSKKLKKYAGEYAANKYGKVGDNLPAVFGYLNLANGSLCASDVKSAISSKLSASAIESAITKAL